MTHQSNPVYRQDHNSPAAPAVVTRPAREASAQQQQQHQQAQVQDNSNEDIYADYARSPAQTVASDHHQTVNNHSIYGGIDSSSYSHHSHAGQRGPSSPPTASLPPLPPLPAISTDNITSTTTQNHPRMYPDATAPPPAQVSNIGNYGNPSYLPRDDSVDVSDSALGHGDAASVHSRSHLNPSNNGNHNNNNNATTGFAQTVPRGAQPLMARFRSDQVRPSGVYTNKHEVVNEKVNGDSSQPSSGGSAGQSEKKEHRQLPEGYNTPPAFSRAGSAWGTSPFKSSHQKNGGNNNNNGSSTPPSAASSSPYGPLGGLASKSDPALQFAEGDYANTRFARFWLMILSKNIVIRWLCFIVPVLALLWIPGELSNAFLCFRQNDQRSQELTKVYLAMHSLIWYYRHMRIDYRPHANSLASVARQLVHLADNSLVSQILLLKAVRMLPNTDRCELLVPSLVIQVRMVGSHASSNDRSPRPQAHNRSSSTRTTTFHRLFLRAQEIISCFSLVICELDSFSTFDQFTRSC